MGVVGADADTETSRHVEPPIGVIGGDESGGKCMEATSGDACGGIEAATAAAVVDSPTGCSVGPSALPSPFSLLLPLCAGC